jgi:hypothetical protein
LISSQEGGSSRDRTPPRKDSLLIEKENEEMDSMQGGDDKDKDLDSFIDNNNMDK